MIEPLSLKLVHLLAPILGARRAELFVARVYAILFLVTYQRSAQYSRAILGVVWLVLTPLLFLAVYVPVLTLVFHGQLPGATGPYDYAIFIVAGFLPWTAFSDGFSLGAASLVNSPGVVRHAPIPPSLLPAIAVSSTFMGLAIGVAIFLPVVAALGHFPGVRLLLLPLAFLLLYGFTLGLAWLSASVVVFVRDLLQLLTTLLLIEFFACPVVYHPSLAPGRLGTLVQWNPLTPFLNIFRASLAPAAEFAWLDLALASGWTLVVLALGLAAFKKLEGGFSDAV
jgi:lipopolysaccharide transport system permease protein